jgi:hypothetical protein
MIMRVMGREHCIKRISKVLSHVWQELDEILGDGVAVKDDAGPNTSDQR